MSIPRIRTLCCQLVCKEQEGLRGRDATRQTERVGRRTLVAVQIKSRRLTLADPEQGFTCRWIKLWQDVEKEARLLRRTTGELVEVPVWRSVQELKEALCTRVAQGRKLEEFHPSGQQPRTSLRLPPRGNIFAITGQALSLSYQVESTINPTGRRVSSQDSLWRRKAKSFPSNLC